MKHKRNLLKILQFLIVISISFGLAAEVKRFTKTQVLSDFEILYQSVIASHYQPYAYISQEQLAHTYEHIKMQLTAADYSLLETVKYYQQFVAAIKNGHTEIDFPVASYLHYAEHGGTLFPLDLAFESGKALVRANYASNVNIAIGSELVAINGQPITEILDTITPYISAERRYFKLAKLELLSFPRYYWLVAGQQHQYTVTLRTRNGNEQHTLSGVKVFSGFEEKKDEILRAQKTLRFYDSTAYLNPGHFAGDEQAYQTFIDQAFTAIKKRNMTKLIIDLRYNSGGNNSFSDHLVAYLADKPFKWYSSFQLRSSALLKHDTKKNRNLNDPYWQAVLATANGERYKYDFNYQQPVAKERRFTGQVYVLINRHSYSQASVTAAQIKDYGWGVMVGEETADYPSLYASQFHYVLPNTELKVKIAKGYIVRVNGSEAQHGVKPDISIRDHLLDQEDEILLGLLQQLDEDQAAIKQ